MSDTDINIDDLEYIQSDSESIIDTNLDIFSSDSDLDYDVLTDDDNPLSKSESESDINLDDEVISG